jgi:hypothetical protein
MIMSIIAKYKSPEEIEFELEIISKQMIANHQVDIDPVVFIEVVQDALYERIRLDLENRIADWTSASLLELLVQLERKKTANKAAELTEETPPAPTKKKSKQKDSMN